jgi:TPR repeat protein
VLQDDHEALRLYKRAAAKGHAGAASEAARIAAHLTAARSSPPT